MLIGILVTPFAESCIAHGTLTALELDDVEITPSGVIEMFAPILTAPSSEVLAIFAESLTGIAPGGVVGPLGVCVNPSPAFTALGGLEYAIFVPLDHVPFSTTEHKSGASKGNG